MHIDTIQTLSSGLVGVQAAPGALAHLGTGQAGLHGLEEEFVIVERVHVVTGGREIGWAYPGGSNKTTNSWHLCDNFDPNMCCKQ